MVPLWIPIVIRPLIFRVPKKGTIILTTTHIFIFLERRVLLVHRHNAEATYWGHGRIHVEAGAAEYAGLKDSSKE